MYTENPSKIWYVAHMFLWVISGLVCYILWKDKNAHAAKRHLIHSLWIQPVMFVPLIALVLIFEA